MSVRSIPTVLRNYLEENKPFIVAHLIKFERPEIVAGFETTSRGEANDYVYLTDAGRDILFDDGSFSAIEQQKYEADNFKGVAVSTATPNGPQTYRAHRIDSISGVNEGIEAKASSMSIKIDATSLQPDLYATFKGYSTFIRSNVDLSEKGFKEGDKLQYKSGNYIGELIITRFVIDTTDATHPYTFHFEKTSGDTIPSTAEQYRISIISEELTTLLRGNQNIAYTNYINREVDIYRVYIDPETNEIIGGIPGFVNGVYEPKGSIFLFKGIINAASLQDTPGSATTVNWTLTSHWGDFVKVQNRMTKDDDHRGLTELGVPDKDVVIRQSYASDLGFEHAETSINLIATYDREVVVYDLVEDRAWHGLSSDYDLVESTEYVPTDVDLSINLNARCLPVVYGVRKVDSIPIFFDNLKNKPDHVYAAYAICEGSVGGLFDIILDGRTTICRDLADSDARSQQNDNNTVEVLCTGRADKGEVLVGGSPNQGLAKYVPYVYDYDGLSTLDVSGVVAFENSPYYEQATITSNFGTVGATGIQHEKAYTFNDPIDSTFIFHAGLPEQRANNLLLETAAKELFKIQNDYYEGQRHKYWTPNHRLLDTAYCVGEFIINDGETTMPKISFIVKGRDINCYNYDDSYAHNPSSQYASELLEANTNDFDLGMQVTVTGTGITSYTTKIIDRWFLQGEGGLPELRIRLAQPPQNPTYDIILTNGSSQWHMLVGGAMVATGEVAVSLFASNTSFSGSGDTFSVTYSPSTNGANGFGDVIAATNSEGEYIARLGLSNLQSVGGGAFREEVSSFSYANMYYTQQDSLNNTFGGFIGTNFDSNSISTSDFNVTWVRNGINLLLKDSSDATFKPTDDRLVGHTIEVILFPSDGSQPYVQRRKIVKWIPYGGSNSSFGNALVDIPWDAGYMPDVGIASIGTWKVNIYAPDDLRVSINPAMQVLDYMKSKRYGKGLKDKVLDLESFKSAARKCDTRSDVTMIADAPVGPLPGVGSVYRKTSGQTTVFEGTVKKASTITIGGTDYWQITFTDVVGKLAVKYTGASKVLPGQLMWRRNAGVVTIKVGAGNFIETVSDFNAMNTAANVDMVLDFVSGTGHQTVLQITSGAGVAADGNPIVKAADNEGGVSASGYNLYDSDNVKYWKYCGWDSNEQRNVTRHQMNHVVDTGSTVFSNINNMLRQFNGILSYSNGTYSLDVRSGADSVLSSSFMIEEEDIIGSIKLGDKGAKKTFNTVSTNIIDPSLNFEGRSVSFFNSDYLKEDLGVPKKGTFNTPSITNYYNARVGIKQFLDESRNGLEISFKMRPSGLSLTAGEIISLSYNKFSWVNKLWRIISLTLNPDGTVNVVAAEHNDSAFIIEAEDRPPAIETFTGTTVALPGLPESPYNLGATQNDSGGIEISWTNSRQFNPATHEIEIYRSSANYRYGNIAVAAAVTNDVTITHLPTAAAVVGHTVEGVSTVNEILPGNFSSGERITIKVLGNTDWNLVANTSGVQYKVGDLIELPDNSNNIDQQVGTTGSAQTLEQVPVVVSVNPATTSVTLNVPVTVAQGTTITYKAPLIASLTSGTSYIDPIIGNNSASVSRYYWIRYKVRKPVKNVAGAANTIIFSDFFPKGLSGVQGTGLLIDVQANRDFNLDFSAPMQFVYDNTGSNIATVGQTQFPTQNVVTVSPINVSGSVSVSFQKKTSAGANSGSPTVVSTSPYTYTYTPPTGVSSANGFDLMPESLEITLDDVYLGVTYTKVETVDFTATRLIEDGAPGLHALEITQTNPVDIVPVAVDGTPDFSGTGNSIQIIEGGTPLKFQNAGTLSNGEYSLTATSTVITPGTPTGQNTTTATFLVSSQFGTALVADGVIEYTATGKRLDGTAFTRTFEQVISVKNSSRSVEISVDDQTIEYDGSGLNPNPSTITVEVNTYGLVSPYINITAIDGASTPNTYTVVTNQQVSTSTYKYTTTINLTNFNSNVINLASMPLRIEVEAFEGNNTAGTLPVVAADATTVIGNKNGTSNAIVYAYQRSATALTSNPGNVTVTLGTGQITTPATDALANGWTKTPPSGNNPLYFCAATAAGVDATDTIAANEWTSPAILAASSKTNVVTADSLVFTRAEDTTISPSTVTITAQTQNTTQDGVWTTTAGTLTNIVNTHTGPSCEVTSSNFTDGMEVTYTLHSDDGSIADSVILQQLNDGDAAITAVLSNSTHVFPTASNGAVTSHAGSGTNLQVFEGGTELTFTTGTPANGEYNVTVGNTANITEGVRQADPGGGIFCNIPDHSATSNNVDTYIITYSVSGKSSHGVAFTTTVDQTLSKAKDAPIPKTTVVSPDSLIFVKAEDGTLSPSTITITANNQNTTTDGVWATTAGTLTNVVNTHTGASCEVTSANFVDGMVVSYTLASADGSVVDSTTLKQVDEGSGTVLGVLSNSTHVLPANSAGTVTSTVGSGTDIRVFEGGTELSFVTTTPNAGEYNVSVGNTADITEGTPSVQGTFCRIGQHSNVSASVDSYVITYTISGKTRNGDAFTTFTLDQSLSKVKDGIQGQTTTTAFIYQRTTTSSAPSAGNNNGLPEGDTTFTFASGGMQFTTANGWSEDIPNTAGRYLWIARATASAAGNLTADTIAETEWGNIELFAHDPVDIMQATLTNPYQDISINASNERVFDATDTDLQVFEGSQILTPVVSNPGNGEYAVTVSSTGGVDTFSVTANEISTNPHRVVAPEITTLTDNSGTRKFSVNGKRFNGESFTGVSVEQHFKTTEGIGIFKVLPGADGVIFQFPYEGDREVTPTQTVTLSLSGFDLEDGATYSVETYITAPNHLSGTAGSPTSITAGGTGNYGVSRSFSTVFEDYPITYRHELKRDDSGTVTTLATDTLVYFATRSGTKGDGSVAVTLSNEGHTIRLDESFTPVMDNSGTDIQVQEGSFLLDYVASNPGPGEYTVSATGAGGIVPGGINAAANNDVLGVASGNLFADHLTEAFDLQDFDGDGELDSWKYSSTLNQNANSVIANDADAPFIVQGGSRAERLQAPSGDAYGTYSIIAANYQNFTATAVSTYWMSVYVKKGTSNYTVGPNLITNGEFTSNATGWSLGSDFTWHNSGRVERTSGSTNSFFSQDIDIVEGKTYRIRYDVQHTSGGNQTNQYSDWSGTGNANHGSNLYGSGSVDITITAGHTSTIPFRLYGIGTFRGYFDNVRIEEVVVPAEYVYLKNTADSFQSSVNRKAVFNLTNGTVVSTDVGLLSYIDNTDLPTNWYRIAIRSTAFTANQMALTSNPVSYHIGLTDDTSADGFSSGFNSAYAHFWGARLEQAAGTAPGAYASAVNSIARVSDHGVSQGGFTSNTPSVDYQINAIGIGGDYLGTIVKRQTHALVNPAATLSIAPSAGAVIFNGNNINPASVIVTPSVSGIDATDVHYRWQINNGSVQYTSAGSSALTVSGYSATTDFPKTVVCSVYTGTNNGQGNFLASDVCVIVASSTAESVNINASMGNHVFDGNADGVVEFNDFESEFKVVVGGTTLAYNTTTTTPNSFKFGTITALGNTNYASLSVHPTTGVITIPGNSSILSNAAHLNQDFSVPVIHNDTGTTVGIYIISLTKRLGVRNMEMIEVDSTSVADISASEAAQWVSGTLGNQAAQDIMAAAISASSDGVVRPGDQIKVLALAGDGVRIYQNSVAVDVNTTITNVSATHFSSPVVSTIPGSLLVNGSVSAATIAAGTTLSNNIRVNNRITIGASTIGSTSSAAAINTNGKTTFGSGTAGFFIGKHSNNYALNIGDSNNFLKFNGSTGDLQIKQTTGGFELKSGTSGARLEIVNDKIIVRDSNGTIRVQIGDLT